jgi:hypothetical protein
VGASEAAVEAEEEEGDEEDDGVAELKLGPVELIVEDARPWWAKQAEAEGSTVEPGIATFGWLETETTIRPTSVSPAPSSSSPALSTTSTSSRPITTASAAKGDEKCRKVHGSGDIHCTVCCCNAASVNS